MTPIRNPKTMSLLGDPEGSNLQHEKIKGLSDLNPIPFCRSQTSMAVFVAKQSPAPYLT